MTTFALKGLLGRKLRTALTAVAIVLGVAMVSGTFVLTDSIDKAFDAIFTEVRQGSTVVISGRSAFDVSEGSGTISPTLDAELVDRVRALDGVADAEGGLEGEATLIDEDGEALVFGGAPNLGFSIARGESPFNPLDLVDGEWPSGRQVVIDEATADRADLGVGDEIGVQASGRAEQLEISGIVRFGSVSTIGGATLAGFDLETAQRLFGKEGRVDEIAVAASAGTTDAELLAELEDVLPPEAQAKSAAQQASDDAAETSEFITFLRGFLLAFGGIALFVGSFVIANSLSITIAQRTREFATLRTIGGSRRQVLASIVIEALVVGLAASVTGLFLGLALARLLFWLFDAVGFTLPNSGLVFEPRTAVVAITVGVVVTLLASLRPATRATRVPPIAAVREGATLPESRLARYRLPGSIVLATVGFAALSYGLFADDLGTTQLLTWMGLGALLIFFGVALFAERVVRPLATAVGPLATWAVVVLSVLVWPLFTLPFWLLRRAAWGPGSGVSRLLGGILGALLNPLLLAVVAVMALLAATTRWEPEWPFELPGVLPDRAMTRTASHNARRNPQRTASTASALMIGLALVTLVAMLAQGITASFRGAVDDLWGGAEYAITHQNNFAPIPVTAADAVAEAPGVEAVGNVRTGQALAFGEAFFATAVSPETQSMFTVDWQDGSQDVLGSLGTDGAFVDDGYAEEHDLAVGSEVDVTFASGETRAFEIRGIFEPPAGGSPFGPVTISAETWDELNEQPRNLYSFVRMTGGQTPENQAVLDAALADFPTAKAQTREEFIDNQIAGLSSVLNILYVLLALSVIVSLFGIVNTLVLTVFERTREIGMLRAIGMTRLQVRRMIRHESVITALIGGALGILLGLVLAMLLIARVEFIVLAVPVVSLLLFTLAAIVVGIVAAIFPARRAARLNVLRALQYE